jgi:hypothetical protein
LSQTKFRIQQAGNISENPILQKIGAQQGKRGKNAAKSAFLAAKEL